MTKVGVIGANGQVASEVCLLLRNYPSIQLVPICRNPTGSAVLRYHGVPCRHGHVADARQARSLLGDCDVVLNFALPVGRPRQTLETNRRLIENSTLHSAPNAVIIYFSTQRVHRSFRPSGAPPWRSAYGGEKLRCERLLRRSASRHSKEVFVLRLGHVCGEFQTMTWKLREMTHAGLVAVPAEGGIASNVVHTVTIVEAVTKILDGFETPGTYDLVNCPQWTWDMVLEHEAHAAGLSRVLAAPGWATHAPGHRNSERLYRSLAGAARKALASPAARDIGSRLLVRLPDAVNELAQAQHFRRRAAAEAGGPQQETSTFTPFTFGPGGTRFLRSLSPTVDLMAAPTALIEEWDAGAAFPPDLPPAQP